MLVALTIAASAAQAHPLGFGYASLDERVDGAVRVHLRVSGTEQQGSALSLDAPAGCATSGVRVETRADERATWATWRCPTGIRGRALTLRGLEGAGVQVELRARFSDGARFAARFDDDARTHTLDRTGAPASAWRAYLALGARHLAEGVDHLAFMLALALWIPSWRALVVALTGFTLGHSVTLALGALGALRLPSRPVEACIALSVAMVAWELARETAPPRRPGALCAGVGMVHGLGFAGALASVGLPRGARLEALLAFNLGLELAQLAFVGLALIGRWSLRGAGLASPRARRVVIEALGAWSVLLLLQRMV